MENKLPFIPVIGSEEDIKSSGPKEGHLYFSTNTKKIFCGFNEQFLMMGGSIGIYFGNRTIAEDELEESELFFEYNDFENLENISSLNKDDLILNIPDGCFYRIMELLDDSVRTNKLTIAGSGSDSGGGTSGARLSIEGVNKSGNGITQMFIKSNPQDIYIEFKGVQFPVIEDNRIKMIQYFLNGKLIYTDTSFHNFNETIKFDYLKDYLLKLDDSNISSNYSLKIQITDSFGTTSRLSSAFLFQYMTLDLTSKVELFRREELNEFQENLYLNYYFDLKASGLLNPKMEFKLINTQTDRELIYNTTEQIYNSTMLQAQFNAEILRNNPGIYDLQVTFSANAGTNTNPIIVKSNTTHNYYFIINESYNGLLFQSDFVSPTEIQQYDKLTIKYYLCSREKTDNIPVVVKLNDNIITSIFVSSNTICTYEYIAFDANTQNTIKFEINGEEYYLGVLKIISNTLDIPKFENIASAEYCFQVNNRSNSEEQPDEYKWTAQNGITYDGIFENFLWGEENGWIMDAEEDQPALKLTNGAKFSVPDYNPLFKNALANDSNSNLTIELDFKINNITNFSKSLISCLGYTGEKYINGISTHELYAGFEITGTKALLNTSKIQASTMNITDIDEDIEDLTEEQQEQKKKNDALQGFTQYLNTNTRIHLTYVFTSEYIYTYLDGALSGIVKTGNNDVFKDALETDRIPASLIIDSQFGDILIYGIRFYRQALSHNQVLNNYIASFLSMDKKIDLYQQNKLFNSNQQIDYNAIQSQSEYLKIPYVILTGGIGGNSGPGKWKKDPAEDLKPGSPEARNYATLPNNKKDFRLFSMEMYLPGEESAVINIPIQAHSTNDETIIANSIQDLKNNNEISTWHVNRGVQVYGQGTSSMEYPIKNLRLKFIQENDYPVIFNKNDYAQEIICFKADYMDSSSCHNTGTGNFIQDFYTSLNMKTPAQKFKEKYQKQLEEKYPDRLITAITGFPIICFYRENEESELYQYIGRYNFNMDKATPDPFGFTPKYIYKEDGEFTSESDGKIYYELEDEIGCKTKIVDGKKVLEFDSEGDPIDIIQCWEIKNNVNDTPVKFLKPSTYKGKTIVKYEDLLSGDTWTDFYEDRHPDKYVKIYQENDPHPPTEDDDAALEQGFFRLSKWLNSTAVKAENSSPISNASLLEPKYYKTLDKECQPNKIYYNSEYQELEIEKTYQFSPTESSEKITGKETESIYYIQREITNSSAFCAGVQDINEQISAFGNQIDLDSEPIFSFAYIHTNPNPEDDSFIPHWELEVLNKATGETELSINTEAEDAYQIDINIMDDFGFNFIDENNLPTIDIYYTVETFIVYNGWSAESYERFDRDTEGYRLAKFKNEFKDYLDFDFCLIYYILTLLFVMMDSRAKNMMLASWDRKIWYPIFYDMDTMMGVNNVGYNKFDYDVEDDFESHVFNGFDSVLWYNFKLCFEDEIKRKYEEIATNFTLDNILQYYNTNQADAWNEALITADTVYKYIYPYENGYWNGIDENNPVWVEPYTKEYFYAAQGKRSLHRAYWLKNRIKYLGGKYGIGDGAYYNFRMYSLPEQQNSQYMRQCVNDNPANHRFSIMPNHKTYLSMKTSNVIYGPELAEANVVHNIGPILTLHEVETYIYNASSILDLGDLSNKYLGSFTIFGDHLPLLELKLGRSSRSHRETYNTYYNKLLGSIPVKNNTTLPYLKKINVARCTALQELDLRYFPKLEEVDAEGCQMKTIDFPSDSILKKLFLPTTLTSLTLKNQPRLELIEFDNDEEENDEDRVLNIGEIDLQNLPLLDTYSLLKRIFRYENHDGHAYYTPVNYNLRNLNMVISQITDYEESNGAIIGNELQAIALLENLLNSTGQALDQGTSATNVTGTLTIDCPIKVDEYDIYIKYHQAFPNLKIIYNTEPDKVQLTPAIDLILYDANKNTLFETKSNGTKTLAQLTLDNNNNSAFRNPTKADDIAHTYTFTKYWKDVNNPSILYYDNRDGSEPDNTSAIKFTEYTLTNKLELEPIFDQQIRKYQVHLYDGDTEIISGEYDYDSTIAYNPILSGSENNAIPQLLNYNPGLPPKAYMRYSLKGWTNKDFMTQNIGTPNDDDFIYNFTDKTTYQITTNNQFYAYYIEENCKTTPSPEQYFTYTPVRDQESNNIIGLSISLNKSIAPNNSNNLIRLTIPTRSIYNQREYDILEINSFNENSSIESIFVLNDSQIQKIKERAFQNCTSLRSIYLNYFTELTTIGMQAFTNFQMSSANKNLINLSTDISFYGTHTLVNNENKLDEFTFSVNDILNHEKLDINNDIKVNDIIFNIPDSTPYQIVQKLFDNSENKQLKVTRVLNFNIFSSNIKFIGSQCFNGCSKLRINDLSSLNDCFIGYQAFSTVHPSLTHRNDTWAYRLYLPNYIGLIMQLNLGYTESNGTVPENIDPNNTQYLIYTDDPSTKTYSTFEGFGFEIGRNIGTSYSNATSYLDEIIINNQENNLDAIVIKENMQKYGFVIQGKRGDINVTAPLI